jgi:hypothetical protein
MRKNDKEILRTLLDDHIDTDKYGLGYSSGLVDYLLDILTATL